MAPFIRHDEVGVPVAVHVGRLDVLADRVVGREPALRRVGEPAAAVAEEEPVLAGPRDHEVEMTVAGEVGGLDGVRLGVREHAVDPFERAVAPPPVVLVDVRATAADVVLAHEHEVDVAVSVEVLGGDVLGVVGGGSGPGTSSAGTCPGRPSRRRTDRGRR